jgi:hypothetical protein
VYVNDEVTFTTLSTSLTANVLEETIDITLPKGTNSIRFMPSTNYTPRIDKIQLVLKTGLPADIYFSEAEDAALSSGSEPADSDCSGGYKVTDIGPLSTDHIAFIVSGLSTAGVYECVIDYLASSDATIILANTPSSSSTIPILFPSTGGEIGTITIPLELGTSYNYLNFYGNSDGEIDMDCLRIIKRSETIIDDSSTIRYEAESTMNTFAGDAEADVNYNRSENAEVINVGVTSSDYLELNNVYAPSTGDYLCTFSYLVTSDELLDVKVNTASDIEISFKDTNASGIDEVSVMLSLTSGNNTIKLHQPSGGVDIDIDYMDVTYYEEIFSDDFESGTLNNWSSAGTAGIYTGTPHNGSYGVELNVLGNINKTSLSTEDYEDIYVGFDLAAYNLDLGDYCYVQWYDGSSWSVIALISDGDTEEQQAFTHYNIMLPAGADDNADFGIAVGIFDAGQNSNSYGYVDDIVVGGKPIE